MTDSKAVVEWLDDPVTHERLEGALRQTRTRVKGHAVLKGGPRLSDDPRFKMHEYDAADLILYLLRERVV